jgi:transcriptional regulator NrdR family protein
MNCPKCHQRVAIYEGVMGEKLYLCHNHGRIRQFEKAIVKQQPVQVSRVEINCVDPMQAKETPK